MKNFTCALFVFIGLMGVVLGGEHTRAAEPLELVGIWRQVSEVAGVVEDISDPWYSGEQLLMFTETGHMKSLLVKGKRLPLNAISILENAWGSTRYEALDEEQGLISLKYQNGTEYRVLCTYCKRDGSDMYKKAGKVSLPRSGDIILSYVDSNTNEELFKRLLRRVK